MNGGVRTTSLSALGRVLVLNLGLRLFFVLLLPCRPRLMELFAMFLLLTRANRGCFWWGEGLVCYRER